jgi:hypothetical protein
MHPQTRAGSLRRGRAHTKGKVREDGSSRARLAYPPTHRGRATTTRTGLAMIVVRHHNAGLLAGVLGCRLGRVCDEVSLHIEGGHFWRTTLCLWTASLGFQHGVSGIVYLQKHTELSRFIGPSLRSRRRMVAVNTCIDPIGTPRLRHSTSLNDSEPSPAPPLRPSDARVPVQLSTPALGFYTHTPQKINNQQSCLISSPQAPHGFSAKIAFPSFLLRHE